MALTTAALKFEIMNVSPFPPLDTIRSADSDQAHATSDEVASSNPDPPGAVHDARDHTLFHPHPQSLAYRMFRLVTALLPLFPGIHLAAETEKSVTTGR